MRQFVLCLILCYFVLVFFFSPLSIAITSLGEERANLSAFRTFVRVLSVSSSCWCLGRAAVCDCGTLWIFLLPFFQIVSTPFQTKWVVYRRKEFAPPPPPQPPLLPHPHLLWIFLPSRLDPFFRNVLICRKTSRRTHKKLKTTGY